MIFLKIQGRYIVFQISIMMSETQIDLRLFFFFRVKFLPNYKEILNQKLHRFRRFRGTKAQLTQIRPADVFLSHDVISTMGIVLCLQVGVCRYLTIPVEFSFIVVCAFSDPAAVYTWPLGRWNFYYFKPFRRKTDTNSVLVSRNMISSCSNCFP